MYQEFFCPTISSPWPHKVQACAQKHFSQMNISHLLAKKGLEKQENSGQFRCAVPGYCQCIGVHQRMRRVVHVALQKPSQISGQRNLSDGRWLRRKSLPKKCPGCIAMERQQRSFHHNIGLHVLMEGLAGILLREQSAKPKQTKDKLLALAIKTPIATSRCNNTELSMQL